MLNSLTQFETTRTTITLPVDLINRSQYFIENGTVPSRNALIVAALEEFVAALERQDIDRQFEMMADDKEYQTLNQELAESFAKSDWEALVKEES